MKKKITDAQMAKALGYKVTTKAGVPSIRKQDKEGKWDRSHSLRLPAYTTSLDAITAEIEARGLSYSIVTDAFNPGGGTCKANVCDMKRCNQQYAKTAPLALCAALLQFLKENK